MEQNKEYKKLAEKLEIQKRKLLDLSLKNKMINFKDSSSNLEIISPDIKTILKKIANNDKLEFASSYFDSKKIEEIKREELDNLDFYYDSENDNPKSKKEKSNLKIQTNKDLKDEYKTLNLLSKKTKEFKDEYSIDILYLALGTLVYFDNSNPFAKEEKIKAPLLFCQAKLERKNLSSNYVLSFENDKLYVNESLIQKLKLNYNIDIDFEKDNKAEDENDDSDFSNTLNYFEYVEQVKKTIPSNFSVEDSVNLSIFSFQKINMVKDIERNKEKFLDNVLIKQLLNNSSESSIFDISEYYSEKDIDNILNIKEYYHALDSDSSQEVAIQNAIKGLSFVLQGPPGTGKSQTIANIISELIARNKKVLFVSEKLAALQVVYNNLSKIGINKYCFPLHSVSTKNKSEIYKELWSVLENADVHKTIDKESEENILNNYEEAKNALNNLGEYLFKKSNNINKNIYEMYQEYFKHINLKETIALSNFSVNSITSDKLNKYELKIKYFEKWINDNKYSILTNPFKGLSSKNLLPDEIEYLTKFHLDFIKSFSNIKTYINLISNIIPISKDDKLENILKTLNFINEHLKKLTGNLHGSILNIDCQKELLKYKHIKSLYEENLQIKNKINYINLELLDNEKLIIDYYTFFREYKNAFKRAFSKKYKEKFKKLCEDMQYKVKPKFNLFYKDLKLSKLYIENRNTLLHKISELNYKLFDIDKDLYTNIQNIEWFNELTIYAYKNNFELNKSNFSDYQKIIQKDFITQFDKELIWFNQINTIINGFYFENIFNSNSKSINELDPIVSDWHNKINKIFERIEFNKIYYDEDNDELIKAFLSEIISRKINKDIWGIFAKSLFLNLINNALSNNMIDVDSSDKYQNFVEMFRKYDKKMIDIAANKIEYQIKKYIPQKDSLDKYDHSKRILRKEINKKSKLMPFLKLFKLIPDLILQLKPCIMMSPLSVSSYLFESDIEFDTVIFDEASQITTENALCAIARGKQLIICGDNEQLPPTSFFKKLEDDNEYDEEDDSSLEGLESVLDAANIFLPSKKLKWHYRSKYEELIIPSNEEIYKELITFPSNDNQNDYSKIKFIKVKGSFINRKNEVEANEVINQIKQIYDKFGTEKSIGIVTFNINQQTLIESKISQLCRKEKKYEQLLNLDNSKNLFIKNIENVQGDERDIIIVSMGYGPNEKGSVSMNFGAINKEGGYRRLNVVFTRAKECLILVSSISWDDINSQKITGRGIKFLQNYLKYAEYGSSQNQNNDDKTTQILKNNAFENYVYNELIKLGYEVDKQVGCSKYKIDLAIKNPNDPSKYVLGIECDGTTYMSSLTARDRDRIRQNVLQSKGWNIYRIWSTNWFINKEKELNNLQKVINSYINNNNETDNKASKELDSTKTNEISYILKKKKVVNINSKPFPNVEILYEKLLKKTNEYKNKEIGWFTFKDEFRVFLQAICPIHTNTLRRNKISLSKVKNLILALNFYFDKDKFLKERNFDYVIFRTTDENSTKRLIDEIWPNELMSGIYEYIKLINSTSVSDVIDYFADLLKMKNTEKFKDTIINALETLKKNNYIELDLLSDKVQIINKNAE